MRLRFWKRQSMTDHTLNISAALREAQLQRLEAFSGFKVSSQSIQDSASGRGTPKTRTNQFATDR